MKDAFPLNTYFEEMKSISSNDLMRGLLGYGLFSNLLPPVFTASAFSNHVINNSPTYDNIGHDYVRYESIRNINVPRTIGLPLPFSYSKLCKRLQENWPKLVEHFKEYTSRNPYKVSKIHIRKMDDQECLFEMNYKGEDDETVDDAELLIGSKFVVNADISNCFPSIYTHSIPWALVGKSIAKTANSNKWFQKIDKATRNIKNQETNGILIGPHSSNLIAEIVLVVVDRALIKKGYKITRHIDDYTCFCKTNEEAQQFLIDLSKLLKEFELSLNHKKTIVSKLPIALSKHWVRKLSHYQFQRIKNEDDSEFLNSREVEAFLDSSIELMADENDNTAILNWAIKKISKERLSPSALKLFLDKIHHLVLIYPYLVRLLQEHVFDAFKVKPISIQPISENLISEGLRTRQYEMVSYGLFFALHNKFNLKLSNYLNGILESEDCIVMTMAFLHQLNAGRSVVRFHRKAIELESSNIEQYWIFVYEVLSAQELNGNYANLKNQGISFFKLRYLK